MIQVVNKKSYKGDGFHVCRPSPLGNPYSHLTGTLAQFKVSSRDEAVDKYKIWLENRLDNDNPTSRAFVALLDEYDRTGELTLICCCAPERCHAEIIKEFIEECAGKTVR